MDINIIPSFDFWQLLYSVIAGVVSFLIALFVLKFTIKSERKLLEKSNEHEKESLFIHQLEGAQKEIIKILAKIVQIFTNFNSNFINNGLLNIQEFIMLYDTMRMSFLNLTNIYFNEVPKYLNYFKLLLQGAYQAKNIPSKNEQEIYLEECRKILDSIYNLIIVPVLKNQIIEISSIICKITNKEISYKQELKTEDLESIMKKLFNSFVTYYIKTKNKYEWEHFNLDTIN